MCGGYVKKFYFVRQKCVYVKIIPVPIYLKRDFEYIVSVKYMLLSWSILILILY